MAKGLRAESPFGYAEQVKYHPVCLARRVTPALSEVAPCHSLFVPYFCLSTGHSIIWLKTSPIEGNLHKNALIPLPPTGFASLFVQRQERCNNLLCSAQACCGGCWRCSDCKQCKVLQKSAKALRSVTERRRVGQGIETPGVQGLRPEKPTA